MSFQRFVREVLLNNPELKERDVKHVSNRFLLSLLELVIFIIILCEFVVLSEVLRELVSWFSLIVIIVCWQAVTSLAISNIRYYKLMKVVGKFRYLLFLLSVALIVLKAYTYSI